MLQQTESTVATAVKPFTTPRGLLPNAQRKRYYTGDEDSKRPFRLWNETEKKNMRYRYYGTAKRALNATMLEICWLPVGATITVYDCRTWTEIGTYTRISASQFTRKLHLPEERILHYND